MVQVKLSNGKRFAALDIVSEQFGAVVPVFDKGTANSIVDQLNNSGGAMVSAAYFENSGGVDCFTVDYRDNSKLYWFRGN